LGNWRPVLITVFCKFSVLVPCSRPGCHILVFITHSAVVSSYHKNPSVSPPIIFGTRALHTLITAIFWCIWLWFA